MLPADMRGGIVFAGRGPKYHSVETTFAGERYQSKREAAYAAELSMRQRGKDIKSWERQVRIPLYVRRAGRLGLEEPGVKVCDYVVDFVITHFSGELEYVEVKGMETDLWKLKWKLFGALHPELKKTIIK